MAPQAWSTEMQLATKTMLRSVNTQRLKGQTAAQAQGRPCIGVITKRRQAGLEARRVGGLGRRRDRHSQVERAPEKPADFDEKKWPLCSQSIIERKRPKGSLPLLKGACVDDDSILQNVDLAKTTAQHRFARAIKRDVARHASAIDLALQQRKEWSFEKIEEQSAQKVQSLLGYDELPSIGSVEKTLDKSRESIAQKAKAAALALEDEATQAISAKIKGPAAAAALSKEEAETTLSRDHGGVLWRDQAALRAHAV